MIMEMSRIISLEDFKLSTVPGLNDVRKLNGLKPLTEERIVKLYQHYLIEGNR